MKHTYNYKLRVRYQESFLKSIGVKYDGRWAVCVEVELKNKISVLDASDCEPFIDILSMMMKQNCDKMKREKHKPIKIDPEEVWNEYMDMDYHDEVDDYKTMERNHVERMKVDRKKYRLWFQQI